MQASSRTDTWLRDPTDPDWVYGYDAWTAPLAPVPDRADAEVAVAS